MANVIAMFKLRPAGQRLTLPMPSGAFPVRAAMQGDVPCVWVMLDEERQGAVPYHFLIVGEDTPIPDGYWPIQGCTFDDGPATWHVVHKVGGNV